MRMQFKSQVQETFDNYKRVNIWRYLLVASCLTLVFLSEYYQMSFLMIFAVVFFIPVLLIRQRQISFYPNEFVFYTSSYWGLKESVKTYAYNEMKEIHFREEFFDFWKMLMGGIMGGAIGPSYLSARIKITKKDDQLILIYRFGSKTRFRKIYKLIEQRLG